MPFGSRTADFADRRLDVTAEEMRSNSRQRDQIEPAKVNKDSAAQSARPLPESPSHRKIDQEYFVAVG